MDQSVDLLHNHGASACDPGHEKNETNSGVSFQIWDIFESMWKGMTKQKFQNHHVMIIGW